MHGARSTAFGAPLLAAAVLPAVCPQRDRRPRVYHLSNIGKRKYKPNFVIDGLLVMGCNANAIEFIDLAVPGLIEAHLQSRL